MNFKHFRDLKTKRSYIFHLGSLLRIFFSFEGNKNRQSKKLGTISCHLYATVEFDTALGHAN